MVTGFEEHTYELNDFERFTLLPIVVGAWLRKPLEEIVNMVDMISGVNKGLAKLNEERVLKCLKKYPKVTGPRMRKIIQAIRVENLVPNLIANSKGYFTTEDPEKVDKFIASCHERANSFNNTAVSMRKNLSKNTDFGRVNYDLCRIRNGEVVEKVLENEPRVKCLFEKDKLIKGGDTDGLLQLRKVE